MLTIYIIVKFFILLIKNKKKRDTKNLPKKHRRFKRFAVRVSKNLLVRDSGFEPETSALKGRCSTS